MKEVLVAHVRLPPLEIKQRGVFSVKMENRWYVIRTSEMSVQVYRCEGMNDLEQACVARLELQTDAPF